MVERGGQPVGGIGRPIGMSLSRRLDRRALGHRLNGLGLEGQALLNPALLEVSGRCELLGDLRHEQRLGALKDEKPKHQQNHGPDRDPRPQLRA